jgi:uncharacterized membrane protein (UPF0127 family)
MKKIFFILFIIVSITCLFFLTKKENTINYLIDGKKYRLLIADSPEEWEKGLMYVRKLNNADGMIFIFPDKQTRTFWNKNTYLNLDVYWIQGNQIVGKDHLPSIEKSKDIVYIQSIAKIDKALEIVR